MTDTLSPDGFDGDAIWEVLWPCEDDATILAILLAKVTYGVTFYLSAAEVAELGA